MYSTYTYRVYVERKNGVVVAEATIGQSGQTRCVAFQVHLRGTFVPGTAMMAAATGTYATRTCGNGSAKSRAPSSTATPSEKRKGEAADDLSRP